MLVNVDYKLIFPPDEDCDENSIRVYIELLKEPFSKVIYKYGVVSVEESGDSAILTFTYELVEKAGIQDAVFDTDPGFKQLLGDILVELINNGQNEGTEEYIDEIDSDDI